MRTNALLVRTARYTSTYARTQSRVELTCRVSRVTCHRDALGHMTRVTMSDLRQPYVGTANRSHALASESLAAVDDDSPLHLALVFPMKAGLMALRAGTMAYSEPLCAFHRTRSLPLPSNLESLQQIVLHDSRSQPNLYTEVADDADNALESKSTEPLTYQLPRPSFLLELKALQCNPRYALLRALKKRNRVSRWSASPSLRH